MIDGIHRRAVQRKAEKEQELGHLVLICCATSVWTSTSAKTRVLPYAKQKSSASCGSTKPPG
jgi:hypothetical protein